MGLLDRVFGPKTVDEEFVNSPMRDNWYQSQFVTGRRHSR